MMVLKELPMKLSKLEIMTIIALSCELKYLREVNLDLKYQ